MDKQQAKFDWNAWYASIPGIPADWGRASIDPPTAAGKRDLPEEPLLQAA